MAAVTTDEAVELKFRLADGSDIGPQAFGPETTIGAVKEVIISQWPSGTPGQPKSINDIKLINAGKILENNKTVSQSRVPVGEVPGGAITMHVVVRPPNFELPEGDKEKETSQKGGCGCIIL